MEKHTTLGWTTGGNPLSLALQDRLRHIAVIGATGSGKSTLLRQIAAQDIERGDGLLLLDPHGDLAEQVLGDIPPFRYNQVCYLNLADLDFPVGLNVLENTTPDDRARAVDGVVSAMRSIWFDSWGPRMELILRHACAALIETPNASLALLPRLLIDDAYRKRVVAGISSHDARAFFGIRYERWRDTFREEAIDPVLNKVEAFLTFPAIRNVLGQNRSTLHLSRAMRHGRVVIANLATGVVGETAARLFGALLLANLRSAAMARASSPPSERRPFYVIVDEAHALGPGVIASLLSEIRKFAVGMVLVTQYLDALTDTTRAALLGNCGTLVVFRCGPGDAALLARHFGRPHQPFNAWALQSLEDGHAIISPLGQEPTHADIASPNVLGTVAEVARQSRRHYGRPRAEVEAKLRRALSTADV